MPGAALGWAQAAALQGLAVLHRGTADARPCHSGCCELQPDAAGGPYLASWRTTVLCCRLWLRAGPQPVGAALAGKETGAWRAVVTAGRPHRLRSAAQAHPAIPVKPAGHRPDPDLDQSAPSSPD